MLVNETIVYIFKMVWLQYILDIFIAYVHLGTFYDRGVCEVPMLINTDQGERLRIWYAKLFL